jgi:hypothetical protein
VSADFSDILLGDPKNHAGLLRIIHVALVQSERAANDILEPFRNTGSMTQIRESGAS